MYCWAITTRANSTNILVFFLYPAHFVVQYIYFFDSRFARFWLVHELRLTHTSSISSEEYFAHQHTPASLLLTFLPLSVLARCGGYRAPGVSFAHFDRLLALARRAVPISRSTHVVAIFQEREAHGKARFQSRRRRSQRQWW
jgi:hypothetical protein